MDFGPVDSDPKVSLSVCCFFKKKRHCSSGVFLIIPTCSSLAHSRLPPATQCLLANYWSGLIAATIVIYTVETQRVNGCI